MIGNNGLGTSRDCFTTLEGKSPMEDFLFILVISLAVAVSFFANKKLADRFALAEKSQDAKSIPHDEYSRLPVCELATDSTGIAFAGYRFESIKELEKHLEFGGFQLPDQKLLLKVERTRTVGDLEDVKHVFLSRGITVFTEWENRK
jgi:hypothetical protein